MLSKLNHIATGWGRKFKIIGTPDEIQKLSASRMQICGECPNSKASSVLKIINGEANRVSTLKCTICKCPCEQKALVAEEHCPENKW